MARVALYAKRGRINAPTIHKQMNGCNCLTLILACIIYLHANEISRLVTFGDTEASGVDPSVPAHISPIEWGNVVLHGQYDLNQKLIR